MTAAPSPPDKETRKYRMIRVAKGDYLLPSNDLETLWRLYSYEEDGSGSWVDASGAERAITGTHWNLWRYQRPFHGRLDIVEDHDFFDFGPHWLLWATCARTRSQAIEWALEAAS